MNCYEMGGHIFILTKAQLGFSMPLFSTSFCCCLQHSSGLQLRPSPSLARFTITIAQTHNKFLKLVVNRQTDGRHNDIELILQLKNKTSLIFQALALTPDRAGHQSEDYPPLLLLDSVQQVVVLPSSAQAPAQLS